MIDSLSIDNLALRHRRAIQNRLLEFFDGKIRDLPWLRDKSAYRVWVSEIMLQQTQIATVGARYRRFIRRFPTARRLAAAPIEDVLKQWEGLGYYRRAQQLHRAAGQIVDRHGGRFPTRLDDVLALPGIGRYTAAAILSIADDQRLPILEGNTIRLFSRLLMLRGDVSTSAVQKQLWQFSESLLPTKRVGDFNQALMDFGREVCKPKKPGCHQCPIRKYCRAYSGGVTDQIPFTGRKMQYVSRREAIVLIQRGGKVLLRQYDDGRWPGLWDFPRFDAQPAEFAQWLPNEIEQTTGLSTMIKSLNQIINLAVTRYRIELHCFRATTVSGRIRRDGPFLWKTMRQLADLPLNASARKFARQFALTCSTFNTSDT